MEPARRRLYEPEPEPIQQPEPEPDPPDLRELQRRYLRHELQAQQDQIQQELIAMEEAATRRKFFWGEKDTILRWQ